MRRILIFCCTYYQLITAIQMKKTIFYKDDVILGLSDDSNNSRKIYKNLCKQKGFENSIYFEHKANIKNSNSKISIIKKALIGDESIQNKINQKLDLLLFFNVDFYVYWIYATLRGLNKHIETAFFEESFISNIDFLDPSRKLSHKILKALDHIRGKQYIFDSTKYFYSFNPSLYCGKLISKKIPEINVNDPTLIKLLKNIFEIDQQSLTYSEKYIYFSGIFEEMGESEISELNFIKKICGIVGIDNLLIKVHPRDNADKYKKSGFHVDCNSSIPFEVIQLSHDFSKNVFITSTSSSVLSVNTIVNEPTPVIFTYKCINSKSKAFNKVTTMYDRLISFLERDRPLMKIFVPHNLSDLSKIINNE